MFIGEIDVTEISLVPVLATDGMQFVIYLVHFFAVFLTASAVILAFGSRLVRRLHLKYLPGKHLNLIYGVNEDTLRFGSALIQEKKAERCLWEKVRTKRMLTGFWRWAASCLTGTTR